MKLRSDFSRQEIVPFDSIPWAASPDSGVLRKMLERDGEEIARATSFVQYAPGSSFHSHVHDEGEELVVLEGTFSDENGDYAAGTYVRNPPRSRHAPFSRTGCVIFVKLRQIAKDDLRQCVLDVASTADILHTHDAEQVSAMRLKSREHVQLDAPHEGVVELLVLSGSVEIENVSCAKWTWARVPHTLHLHNNSQKDATLWIKRSRRPAG